MMGDKTKKKKKVVQYVVRLDFINGIISSKSGIGILLAHFPLEVQKMVSDISIRAANGTAVVGPTDSRANPEHPSGGLHWGRLTLPSQSKLILAPLLPSLLIHRLYRCYHGLPDFYISFWVGMGSSIWGCSDLFKTWAFTAWPTR